jgi:hypothetical protein
MDQQRHGPKIMTLWVLVVLGIAYSSLLYTQPTLTGMSDLDGIIGVVLGLYICSHPAANLVDMLFYRRSIRYQFSSKRSTILWVVLNVLILLIGGIVIFIGTTRFIGRADSRGFQQAQVCFKCNMRTPPQFVFTLHQVSFLPTSPN